MIQDEQCVPCRNNIFRSVCGECNHHDLFDLMEGKPSYAELESQLAAANKIIAEGREQYPVASMRFIDEWGNEEFKSVYLAPVLPPDAAELKREK
jgi:hypothetical protein